MVDNAAEIDGLASLHVAVAARIDLERVPVLLGGPDLPWLGERVAEAEGHLRRYHSDLEVHLTGMGPFTLRKAALIGLGVPQPDEAGWTLPLEWQAATMAPLFPVFVGSLSLRADRALVDGHYAPPGGRLGQVADALLLGIAARGTARWFLTQIVKHLDNG
ncbi:MAG: hypothetical protein ACHQZR_01745 [Candidatus Limnocylindrales bacterium]